MARTFLLLCVTLLLGIQGASAQSCQDIIDKRQSLMKRSAEMARMGSAMIRGEVPFDAAKVQEILAAFAEDAGAMPSLFPDCSKTGLHTTAAPAIWNKADDFKAAVARFAADIKAAQDNVKDTATLKTAFQMLGRDCGNCHQAFRTKTD
jgi:cytochrome c556